MRRIVMIPKRNGTYRTVVCVDRRESEELRENLAHLEVVAIALDPKGVQHGFTPGRSPVTCAKAHVGYRWTLSMDLADCFGHVTRTIVASYMPHLAERPDLFHRPHPYTDSVAAQGLPTSPVLANIVLSQMDAAILKVLAGRGVYTRYADDLVVSSNDRAVIDEMLRAIPTCAASVGQEVAKDKTSIQDGRGGHRIIVGVGVSDTGIHPTRAAKRRLRAARHQNRKSHANGLAEWCRLREPRLAKAVMRAFDNGDTVLAQLLASRM